MTRLALAVAALVVAGGVGFGLWTLLAPRADALAACREGGALTGAEIGGPFELVSETGETVSSTALIDRPTLIYFGFANCERICPVDAFNMGRAADLLEAEATPVRTLFVSIDPARDTPEALAAYTDAMHPEMIGLTGSEQAVAEAAKAYKVYYARAGDDPERYMMDHSTFTYLVHPDAGLLDFFRHDTPPETIAERVACHARALG
jgi:protein SCO1/2